MPLPCNQVQMPTALKTCKEVECQLVMRQVALVDNWSLFHSKVAAQLDTPKTKVMSV